MTTVSSGPLSSIVKRQKTHVTATPIPSADAPAHARDTIEAGTTTGVCGIAHAAPGLFRCLPRAVQALLRYRPRAACAGADARSRAGTCFHDAPLVSPVARLFSCHAARVAGDTMARQGAVSYRHGAQFKAKSTAPDTRCWRLRRRHSLCPPGHRNSMEKSDMTKTRSAPAPAPKPKNLEQQKTDFTDEGSPPPGVAGTAPPAHAEHAGAPLPARGPAKPPPATGGKPA